MGFLPVLPRNTPEYPDESGMQMLSIRRVSQLLACSPSTVRREISRRRLRAVRFRGIVRVSQAALEAYVASCAKR